MFKLSNIIDGLLDSSMHGADLPMSPTKQQKEIIKAPKGTVLRAYMIDCYTHKPRRVLIDQWGLVFARSGLPGWAQRQSVDSAVYDSESTYVKERAVYKFVVLPEPVKMWGFELWNYWWEAKAWNDSAWAWMHLHKED